MANSSLDPDNLPENDRQLGKGHGTRALGPSDTSDSGSDMQEGFRWTNEADLGLDKGTLDDPDSASLDRSVGPDIGDAGLDSDTDSHGTGEAAAAGRDTDIEMGADIGVDRIDELDTSPDLAEDASAQDAAEGTPTSADFDPDAAQRRRR
jgi:hypothetical protein